MNEEDFYADVSVGGKIVYLKPMKYDDGYFGGTVGIQASARRKGFLNGRKTLVKGFLSKKDWDYLMAKGAKPFDYLAVGGQIEEWLDKKGNSKSLNVFDSIINFKSA